MKKHLTILILSLIFTVPLTSNAEKTDVAMLGTKNDEQLATAMGHFERARSLLIAAVQEFDRGLKLSNPSPLLKSSQWRNTVIDQAASLEKVLAPRPRTTESGIKFQADSRLLHEAK